VGAHLHRGRTDTRHWLIGAVLETDDISGGESIRKARERQIRFNKDAPRAIERDPERLCDGRSSVPRRPNNGFRAEQPITNDHASIVDVFNNCGELDFDSKLVQLAEGAFRE
jgi:hypothetical protein